MTLVLYGQEKKLERLVRTVYTLYCRVGRKENVMTHFKAKMVILFLLNEMFLLFYCFITLYENSENVIALYDYAAIPVSFAAPIYFASYTFCTHSLTHPTVAAYFCLWCYLLAEIQSEFKTMLRNKAKEGYLLDIYVKITELLREVNDALHPSVLCVFMMVLSTEFEKAYQAIFLFEGTLAAFNMIFVMVMFSSLELICRFSSSVIQSLDDIKKEALKVSMEVSDSRRLRFFIARNLGVQGFRFHSDRP